MAFAGDYYHLAVIYHGITFFASSKHQRFNNFTGKCLTHKSWGIGEDSKSRLFHW